MNVDYQCTVFMGLIHSRLSVGMRVQPWLQQGSAAYSEWHTYLMKQLIRFRGWLAART